MRRHYGSKSVFNLFYNFWLANKGRLIWKKYSKKYNISPNSEYVILMPSEIAEYNYYSMLYIDRTCEANKKIIILTMDDRVKKAAFLFEDRHEILTEKISGRDSKYLLKYYSLYPFYFRFRVASLDEPYGRECSGLVGKKGITYEELIAVGVMGFDIKKYMKGIRQKRPEYKGDDAEIKNFINVRD